MYLHGLSSGDFGLTLGQFLGSSAGLSASVITKLTETWRAEQRTFATQDLSGVDYVHLGADGIHVNIRLDEHKLCLLVMIGVRADGRKELVALADGYRESTESWADLLRDAPDQDHPRAPGSRAAGLAMAFKLIEAAQARWRAVKARHLVALVRRWRPLRGRQARRTTRAPPRARSRLKDLHPQVLTIVHRRW